jgi:hypothetical protein
MFDAGEYTLLRGMSIQLHKLTKGDESVGRNQRWSSFQTQCTIKETACKLIIDSSSYCNGISKDVVATLGLLTWRIPEPKYVEWLNSCVVLKVTHKVHVPFTVGEYVWWGGVRCVSIGGVWTVTWESMVVWSQSYTCWESKYIFFCAWWQIANFEAHDRRSD